ncbi:MAG: hypothetical protein RRA94_04005, partial [Bacteroidota bacterium]|nr:hypothetical protein [Bacteroidota bacterium]
MVKLIALFVACIPLFVSPAFGQGNGEPSPPWKWIPPKNTTFLKVLEDFNSDLSTVNYYIGPDHWGNFGTDVTMTFFIDSANGDDANDAKYPVAGAVKSWSRLVDLIPRNCNDKRVTIYMAPCTYPVTGGKHLELVNCPYLVFVLVDSLGWDMGKPLGTSAPGQIEGVWTMMVESGQDTTTNPWQTSRGVVFSGQSPDWEACGRITTDGHILFVEERLTWWGSSHMYHGGGIVFRQDHAVGDGPVFKFTLDGDFYAYGGLVFDRGTREGCIRINAEGSDKVRIGEPEQFSYIHVYGSNQSGYSSWLRVGGGLQRLNLTTDLRGGGCSDTAFSNRIYYVENTPYIWNTEWWSQAESDYKDMSYLTMTNPNIDFRNGADTIPTLRIGRYFKGTIEIDTTIYDYESYSPYAFSMYKNGRAEFHRPSTTLAGTVEANTLEASAALHLDGYIRARKTGSSIAGIATVGPGDSVQVTCDGILPTDGVYLTAIGSDAPQRTCSYAVHAENTLTIYGDAGGEVSWMRI